MQFPKRRKNLLRAILFLFTVIFFLALFMISLFKRHLIFQVKGSIPIRVLIILSWKNSTTVFNILNMVFLQPYQYIKEPHTTLKIVHSFRFFLTFIALFYIALLDDFFKKQFFGRVWIIKVLLYLLRVFTKHVLLKRFESYISSLYFLYVHKYSMMQNMKPMLSLFMISNATLFIFNPISGMNSILDLVENDIKEIRNLYNQFDKGELMWSFSFH